MLGRLPSRARRLLAPAARARPMSTSPVAAGSELKYEWARPPVQQDQPLEVDGASFKDVMSWPQTKLTALDNGLRIATEALPWNSTTTSVGVFIDAGSRFETPENSGSAHFLEHLAFKGTEKRSREQLEVEVENLGAHLNAYTSREQTVYYSQSRKEDTEQCLDILSDILLNSQLQPAAIDRERQVILQEMENVYKDTKEELIFDHLHENCFVDSPLGQTILGPEKNINSITRDDLVQYIQTYYTADRMCVVATGAVDHDQFVAQVKKAFANVPLKSKEVPAVQPSNFRGCEYDERWDDKEKVYMAIAYETVGWNSPDTYPLIMMQQILGQWNQRFPGGQFQPSPLTRYLYEDNSRPIAEEYMAFNTPYADTGLFGVYGVTHPYDFRYFYHAVRREMNRLGYWVSDGVVEDAREKFKATILATLNSTPAVMEEVGRQILVHGRRIHPAEVFARIDDIDVNAIKTVAHKYLIDRDHAIVAVGATHEFPYYQQLRGRADQSW